MVDRVFAQHEGCVVGQYLGGNGQIMGRSHVGRGYAKDGSKIGRQGRSGLGRRYPEGLLQQCAASTDLSVGASCYSRLLNNSTLVAPNKRCMNDTHTSSS